MRLVLIVGALALASCSSKTPVDDSVSMEDTNTMSHTAASSIYNDDGKQAAWIEQGEDAIKAKLRDPDSAKFRNVEFHGGGGVPIVCGEVNANNGFGGKAGFERFVAAGDAVDVLESEMSSPSEMDPIWDKYCRA